VLDGKTIGDQIFLCGRATGTPIGEFFGQKPRAIMSHVPWTPIGRGTASDMDVAEMLRDFRRRAGLSQAHLAERASMSPAAIGALEQGSRRAPYRQTIVMLANALELGPEDQAGFEVAAQRARNRGPRKLDRPILRNLPGSLASFIEREQIFEIEK
jgi:transcriptional regulator with XRE-family HTH domain